MPPNITRSTVPISTWFINGVCRFTQSSFKTTHTIFAKVCAFFSFRTALAVAETVLTSRPNTCLRLFLMTHACLPIPSLNHPKASTAVSNWPYYFFLYLISTCGIIIIFTSTLVALSGLNNRMRFFDRIMIYVIDCHIYLSSHFNLLYSKWTQCRRRDCTSSLHMPWKAVSRNHRVVDTEVWRCARQCYQPFSPSFIRTLPGIKKPFALFDDHYRVKNPSSADDLPCGPFLPNKHDSTINSREGKTNKVPILCYGLWSHSTVCKRNFLSTSGMSMRIWPCIASHHPRT